MPMFETPKPRKFHYTPRFYDPEKEKWQQLKDKYALQKEMESKAANASDEAGDLEYFQEKIRNWDQEHKTPKLGWKDLFRRREMPKFNYQPRFNEDGTLKPEAEKLVANVKPDSEAATMKRKVHIRRRFDIDDGDYMKPVSASKILLYALIVCLLLYWILF